MFSQSQGKAGITGDLTSGLDIQVDPESYSFGFGNYKVKCGMLLNPGTFYLKLLLWVAVT